jgi:hypothetical protein
MIDSVEITLHPRERLSEHTFISTFEEQMQFGLCRRQEKLVELGVRICIAETRCRRIIRFESESVAEIQGQ